MVISLTALLIGFIMDLIIGDPRSIPHPIIFIGKLISFTEKFMRRLLPKTKKGEIVGGTFTCVIVIAISVIIPFVIIYLAGLLNIWVQLFVQSIMCWQILATNSLKKESMKVYYSLKKADIQEARFNVSMIVGRDTSALSEEGVTKATVETIAENTSDGVIAPMIFMAIGGPCLGFFYKAINTMDSMLGYKNDKYINFGKIPAKLDDIVNFIPARVSAVFMIISSFFLKYDYKNSLKIFIRDRKNHSSPNSAQTESCCAGALNIRLAGDAIYHGKLYKKPFIGDDIRPIDYTDIKKANNLLYATAIISAIVLLSIGFGGALIFL